MDALSPTRRGWQVARRLHRHPAWYRGDRLECPVCGGRFRAMLPGGGRRDVQCPSCGAYDRMRTLWLYLRDELAIETAEGLSVLHFAPERAIAARLTEIPGVRYLSADLEPGAAMATVDITDIDRSLGRFDLIIVSHILEHVPADRRAMSEVRSVLAPGGLALFAQPLDPGRAETYEDPAIVAPAARRHAFGQADHVRIYGRDFSTRLREAGFTVRERRYRDELDPAVIARHALGAAHPGVRGDILFEARADDGSIPTDGDSGGGA